MVWIGSCCGQLFGLKFVVGILNSVGYQDHIKNVCIPQLKGLNNGTLDGITFQQDGANIHRQPAFLDWLDQTFQGRVLALGAERLGRSGHSWAPRSPDLSVPDFAIWPLMKRQVYQHPRPTNINELKAKITRVVYDLNSQPELIQKCHIGVKSHARLCFHNHGGHFEFMK